MKSHFDFGYIAQLLVLTLGCTAHVIAHAETPKWAKSSTIAQSGSALNVICSGTGPSTDIARKMAIESCKSSATQFIPSVTKVKSLTIETEKSVGLHEEITNHASYSGLDCVSLKEAIEDQDASITVWLKCKFDLSKVKLISDDSGPIETAQNRTILGEKKTIMISSIPRCESLIIRGDKPRVINCSSNPMSINMEPSDTEIIVRAKNHHPKSILMKSTWRNHENIQVTLDSL